MRGVRLGQLELDDAGAFLDRRERSLLGQPSPESPGFRSRVAETVGDWIAGYAVASDLGGCGLEPGRAVAGSAIACMGAFRTAFETQSLARPAEDIVRSVDTIVTDATATQSLDRSMCRAGGSTLRALQSTGFASECLTDRATMELGT